MGGLQLFLMISQVALAATLIIIILIQQSDGDSLSGIGGNNLNSALSKQGATSLISKITFGLVILFLLNSLALGSMAKFSNQKLQKDLEKVIDEQDSLQKENFQNPEKPSEKTSDSSKNQELKSSSDSKNSKSKTSAIPSVE